MPATFPEVNEKVSLLRRRISGQRSLLSRRPGNARRFVRADPRGRPRLFAKESKTSPRRRSCLHLVWRSAVVCGVIHFPQYQGQRRQDCINDQCADRRLTRRGRHLLESRKSRSRVLTTSLQSRSTPETPPQSVEARKIRFVQPLLCCSIFAVYGWT